MRLLQRRLRIRRRRDLQSGRNVRGFEPPAVAPVMPLQVRPRRRVLSRRQGRPPRGAFLHLRQPLLGAGLHAAQGAGLGHPAADGVQRPAGDVRDGRLLPAADHVDAAQARERGRAARVPAVQEVVDRMVGTFVASSVHRFRRSLLYRASCCSRRSTFLSAFFIGAFI